MQLKPITDITFILQDTKFSRLSTRTKTLTIQTERSSRTTSSLDAKKNLDQVQLLFSFWKYNGGFQNAQKQTSSPWGL